MTIELSTEAVTVVAAGVLDAAEHDPVLQAELSAAHAQRQLRAEDVRELRAMAPYLPELPETRAAEVYETVRDYERRLAAPGLRYADYGNGTAVTPDELAIFGSGPVLLEAQHGTDPVRRATGKRGAADHGTAGLTALLAAQGMGRAVVPRGMQTGNANVDRTHAIKTAVAQELGAVQYAGFLSLHGMRIGKVVDLRDPTEIHAVIGLGRLPREASLDAAEQLTRTARDELGLRVVVGNHVPHLNFDVDARRAGVDLWDLSNTVSADAQGVPVTARLGASGANNMATYVNDLTATGQPGLRVMQIEMSRSLRFTPDDRWQRPDPKAAQMGVYLGYLLSNMAADVAAHGTIRP